MNIRATVAALDVRPRRRELDVITHRHRRNRRLMENAGVEGTFRRWPDGGQLLLLHQQDNPAICRASRERLMGLEPTTFCMASSTWTPDFQQ
jgi:hypothetical protein